MKSSAVALLASLAVAGSACAQWPMEWASGYQLPGANGEVRAITAFDDGSGSALYVGGSFSYAGAVPVENVARWDGQCWSAVGSGLIFVRTLTVYHDGTGSAVYAGTSDGVHRWNGQQWQLVGDWHGAPYALLGFDDGAGPALYAGFEDVPCILRWDGHMWSDVGGGMNMSGDTPYVKALAIFDDGQGPKLYAGGLFTRAGSVGAGSIARWDGTAWASLPGGGLNGWVNALLAYDDGSGSALYAGGWFRDNDADVLVKRWNGTSWAWVGDGTIPDGLGVHSLAAFDDGSGPALYAGGEFFYLARWNGSTWSQAGAALSSSVWALAAYTPRGGASGLYLGGLLSVAGEVGCAHIARWNGQTFTSLGSGLGLSS